MDTNVMTADETSNRGSIIPPKQKQPSTVELMTADETAHREITPIVEEPEPSWRESIGAGIRIQNPAFGLHLQSFEDSPGYSGVNDPDNQSYHPMDFVTSTSPEESAFIRREIDRERADRETLRRAGGLKGTISEITGAATNPLYYIGGYAAARGVSKFILSELMIEGLSEAALQYQQSERTGTETALNIAAAGAGAAILGPLVKIATAPERRLVNDAFARIIMDEDVPDFAPPQGGSVGAMMPETTIAQETMVGGRVAETMTVGPMSRLLAARSVKARRLAQQIADNPYYMAKHGEGEGYPSIESLQGEFEGINASVLLDLNTNYKAHKAAGGNLSHDQFDEAVGHALYNLDNHPDPHVKASIDFQRRQYNEISGRAQALGLLDDMDAEPFYAASYRPRLYNYKKLSEHMPWLLKTVSRSVMDGIASKGLVVVRLPDSSKAAIRRSSYERIKHNDGVYLIETAKLDRAAMEVESKQVATSLVDNLYNQTKVDPQIEGLMRSAGMLKERTLPLWDNQLAKVLENRSSVIFGKYSKDMGFEISSFEEFGSKTLDDEIEAVSREYSGLIAGAKSGKERASLQKESQAAQQDLFDMRDVVAGQYGKPKRALGLHNAAAVVRLLNAVSMLGGMTISAIPDIARPIMRYGLKPYAKGLVRIATGAANLAPADRVKMGIAIERLTNGRMNALADLGNHDASWIKNWGDIFGNLSLMTRWNDALKSLTSEIGAQTMGEWIEAGTNKKILGRAGLSNRMQETIGNEIKRTGSYNPMDWPDLEARRHFAAALRSEVNSIIVTPGAADLPLLMRSPVGRTLFQFKSFLFASHAKVLVQGMQQADANAAVGLLFMVGLGGMTTVIKDGLRGRDLSKKEPLDMVLDSIDRGGLGGLLMLPVNSVRQLAGNSPSRRISQGVVSNWMGPTPQTLTDLVNSSFQFARGEDLSADGAYLKKHVPLQNLLHWRDIMHRMGDD